MIKNCLKTLALALVAIVVVSCGNKKTGTESLIPADAKMVITVNAQQLMNKMAKGGINVDDFSKLPYILMDSTNKPVANFWSDEAITGIDFKQPVTFGLSPYSGAKGAVTSTGIMRVVMGIKSKDSFIAFVKKQKSDVKIEEGTISYISDDDDMMVGFNSKYIVAVQDVDMPNNSGNRREQIGMAEKKELIKKTLQGAGSKSILANTNYNKLSSSDNDVKVWADMSYFIENAADLDEPARTAYSLTKDAFKDCSSTTVLNFEDGKVTTKAQVYLNKEIAKVLNSTAPQNIDLSLLQNFAGKTLNGVFAFSMNPNVVNDFAKFVKQDGIMNIALSKLNVTSAELFDALTGDAMFVISDLSPELMKQDEPNNVNMGVIAKIKDKSKLDKLMAFPEFAKMLKQEGTNIYAIKKDTFDKPTYLGIANNVLIFSPTKTVVESYISGTAKNTFDMSKLDVLKGKSFGYFFDIQSITSFTKNFNSGGGMLFGNEMGGIVSNVLTMFTNTHMASGSLKDGVIESSGVLNLNNNTVNSLAYMIKTGFKSYYTAQMAPRRGTDAIDLSDVREDGPAPALGSDRVQPIEVK